jgi:hypothetical protein
MKRLLENAVVLVAANPRFAILGESEKYYDELRRDLALGEFSDGEIAAAVKQAVQTENIRRNMADRAAKEEVTATKVMSGGPSVIKWTPSSGNRRRPPIGGIGNHVRTGKTERDHATRKPAETPSDKPVPVPRKKEEQVRAKKPPRMGAKKAGKKGRKQGKKGK